MKYRELYKFIDTNSKKWDTIKSEKVHPYVLIEGRALPEPMFRQAFSARVINTEYRYQPLVIMNKHSQLLVDFYKSFRISHFMKIKDMLMKKPLLVALSISQTIYYFLKWLMSNREFEWVINDLTINKINIGDLIYDELISKNLRFLSPKKYKFEFFKIMLKNIFLINAVSSILSKHNVGCVVVSSWYSGTLGAYLSRCGLYKNIPVLTSSNSIMRLNHEYKDAFYLLEHVTKKSFSSFPFTDKHVQEVDEYLQIRFQGKNFNLDVVSSYKNKKVWSKTELLKNYKLKDTDKPVIFIMPHAFSDIPHGGGLLLFRDFYTWFVETIDAVKDNDKAIWIVKPHPSSYLYGEVGIVEKYIERLSSKNVFLIPEDFSTLSVYNIANGVVTVKGTIGIEASCMGIRTLLSGEAPYGGFGFTIEPKTKEDYFNVLSNIETLDKLTDDEIRTAKQVLYMYHLNNYTKSKIFDINATAFGLSIEDIYKHNEAYFEKITKAISNCEYEDDSYYQELLSVLKPLGKHVPASYRS